MNQFQNKFPDIYQLIFENSFRAMGISRNMKLEIVNNALLKLFGYESQNELIGISIFDLIPEYSFQIVHERKALRAKGEKPDDHFRLICKRKNGETFPCEVEVNTFTVGDDSMFYFAIKDITKEKEEEDKLIASEAKFKGIFNSNMIGMAFSNIQQEIVDANDRFLQTLGYDRDDIKTQVLKWKNLTPPEYFEIDEEAVKEYMQYGYITPYEKEYIRKDGSRVPVLVAAATLRMDLQMGVGFVIDISEIKRIKEEKNKVTRELSTYIYMASHDLKGPLASVIGLTTVAMNEVNDSTALTFLKMIERSTLKLDKSLVNLMKVMKIKNNQLDFREVDFQHMIDDVVSSLKYQEDFDKCEVLNDIKLSQPFLSDPELINSIFQNLIENSYKYRIRLRKTEIAISIKEKGEYISIAVQDNGRGIDEKIIPRVFDMFFRGTLESKGSGLGLFIVKSAVDQLGGEIAVSNKPEGGCIFEIQLPRN